MELSFLVQLGIGFKAEDLEKFLFGKRYQVNSLESNRAGLVYQVSTQNDSRDKFEAYEKARKDFEKAPFTFRLLGYE